MARRARRARRPGLRAEPHDRRLRPARRRRRRALADRDRRVRRRPAAHPVLQARPARRGPVHAAPLHRRRPPGRLPARRDDGHARRRATRSTSSTGPRTASPCPRCSRSSTTSATARPACSRCRSCRRATTTGPASASPAGDRGGFADVERQHGPQADADQPRHAPNTPRAGACVPGEVRTPPNGPVRLPPGVFFSAAIRPPMACVEPQKRMFDPLDSACAVYRSVTTPTWPFG